MYGMMLVCHQYHRLLGDAKSGARAKQAFESLVARAKA